MTQAELRFDGPTYDEKLDGVRLAGQLLRVWGLMHDHKWRTLAEIAEVAGGSEAAVSARLRDLRKPRFGAMTVERRRLEGGLWQYRLA